MENIVSDIFARKDESSANQTSRLGAKQQLFKAFKSDPHTGVFVTKINRKEENAKINILFENQQVVESQLNDIKVMPFDNYLRSNLQYRHQKIEDIVL